MTRVEALSLVRKSEGRLCVRHYRRPDGVIQTAAGKLHSIKRRASRIAAGAFTATLSLCASAAAQTPSPATPLSPDGAQIISTYDNARPESDDGFNAAIVGTVVDPQGAVIPNATLSLVNDRTKQVRTTVTSDEGAYRFPALSAGSYSLHVESPAGFIPLEMVDIKLSASEERRTDVKLEVNETVTVTMGVVGFVEPQDVFVKAAFNDDLAAVKELIASGVDVNVKDEAIDSTALMQAVSHGNHEMVRLLLSAGARVNAKNSDGMTALMMSSNKTSPDIMWTLISAGAKVNRRNEQGFSALMGAVWLDSPAVLQALIDAGAKVNARDDEGKTALMHAAELGNLENVKALLRAGADVNGKDKDDETALSLARDSEHPEVVKLLEDYGAHE
jgi:hypothetical protein